MSGIDKILANSGRKFIQDNMILAISYDLYTGEPILVMQSLNKEHQVIQHATVCRPVFIQGESERNEFDFPIDIHESLIQKWIDEISLLAWDGILIQAQIDYIINPHQFFLNSLSSEMLRFLYHVDKASIFKYLTYFEEKIKYLDIDEELYRFYVLACLKPIADISFIELIPDDEQDYWDKPNTFWNEYEPNNQDLDRNENVGILKGYHLKDIEQILTKLLSMNLPSWIFTVFEPRIYNFLTKDQWVDGDLRYKPICYSIDGIKDAINEYFSLYQN